MRAIRAAFEPHNGRIVHKVSGIELQPERKQVFDSEWLDPEIRRLLERDSPDFDASVREAFLILEERIRTAAGLGPETYGTDLVKAVFHPQSGILKDTSSVGAERQGLFDLFQGAVLFYRNPIAHRSIYYSKSSAFHTIVLVNHLLDLLKDALDKQIDISKYVGAHEGRLKDQRRYFRLDIDDDGDEEQLILADTEPVMTKCGQYTSGTLLTVVLDQDSGVYRRVPAEPVRAASIYGPLGVRLMRLTDSGRLDLVVSWTLGETQTGYFVLRWDGKGYVLVPRETDGLSEPYAGAWEHGFMTHPTWQDVQFVDYDGDGLIEIVHIVGAPDWSMTEYHSLPMPERHVPSWVCRVFKWDSDAERLSMIIETIQLGFRP